MLKVPLAIFLASSGTTGAGGEGVAREMFGRGGQVSNLTASPHSLTLWMASWTAGDPWGRQAVEPVLVLPVRVTRRRVLLGAFFSTLMWCERCFPAKAKYKGEYTLT